jgi:hypothetical protein
VLWHWSPDVHLVPMGSFVVHTAPWQNAPEEQSLVEEQDVVHANPLQAKGAQGVGTAAEQVPSPSHVRAGVADPAEQPAAAHAVPRTHLLHPPAPSQVPSRPQVAGRSWMQSSRGSSPAGTIEHRPGVLDELQVMHARAQVLSQQTPSTQLPLAHCSFAVHA